MVWPLWDEVVQPIITKGIMLTANNPFKNFFIIEIKYLKNTPIILIQICEEKLEILQSNVCFRYKKRSAYADLFVAYFSKYCNLSALPFHSSRSAGWSPIWVIFGHFCESSVLSSIKTS